MVNMYNLKLAILILLLCFFFQTQFQSLSSISIYSQKQEKDTPKALVTGDITTQEEKVKIPRSKARRCYKKEMTQEQESNKYNFKSQLGEDKELFFTFKFEHICNGTYLELGGFDGVTFSNTHVFKHAKQWSGVLIEASPINYAKMIKNRPDEIASINSAICSTDRDLHYVNNHGLKGAISGFVEFAAESFRKQWWNDDNIKNAQIVKCTTLTNVLLEAVGSGFHFDFFSLDTEGAELDVLLSLDFSKVSFGVIFVESDEHNDLKNMSVKLALEKNGYRYFKSAMKSDWFVNENFGQIYRDLLIYPASSMDQQY